MILSAIEPAFSPRRPLIEKGNLPRCAKLKSIVVESDEEEEIIVLPNPTTDSLFTSLPTQLLLDIAKGVNKLEYDIPVAECSDPSAWNTNHLEEYRHFYSKIKCRKRLDMQRELVARRYEQGWSLHLDHFANCQNSHSHSSKATTKQMSQRVLKQKKDHLESVLIDLKHDLATNFTQLPYSFRLNAFTNQCITLEFFGSVIAPLMPGVFTVNFQAHFCGVDSKGKVVQFVDIATSFVCVVNQKGWRSHVYEYWLPDVSTLSCEELYLVLEGEQVEAIVQSSKLGNLVDLSRGTAKLQEKKIPGKKDIEGNGKARDGRGRKRKRNEPAADDTVENSTMPQLLAMVSTNTSKKASLSSTTSGTAPPKAKLSKTFSTPPLMGEPVAKRGRGRPRSKPDSILDNTGYASCEAVQTPQKTGQKRMYGAKLIGKWIRNGAEQPGFVPNYGNTGIDLVNETEDGPITSKKRKENISAPTFEMIEQIQQLTRPISTTNTTLQVEISNENDYGHPETEKKRRIKRSKDLKTLSTQSLQPSIAYQFLQPWSPSTCKLEASPSGDCSPASDCSFSDTSSGYASMSTGSSKSSLKGLEELASSMASLPETTIDSKLFLKCVICDTAFETLQRLMLHLNTSYPSFSFEYGRSKKGVIDVCLIAHKLEDIVEVIGDKKRVNRRKCVVNKRETKERIFLNKKSIEDWRRKILLKKLPSKSTTSSATSSSKCTTSGQPPGALDSPSAFKKLEFEDLFLKNLPFAGPTYTKLSDPPLPNLFGVDTNQGWLKDLSQTRLHQFTDVTESEKDFFVLWNSFVMQRPNRAIGCKRLATLLQNFVELKGHELIERKFLFNFISHCAVLQKQGFINHHEMFDAILLLQKLDIPRQKFYTSPFEQQKLRRSPRKIGSPRKISKEIGE